MEDGGETRYVANAGATKFKARDRMNDFFAREKRFVSFNLSKSNFLSAVLDIVPRPEVGFPRMGVDCLRR